MTSDRTWHVVGAVVAAAPVLLVVASTAGSNCGGWGLVGEIFAFALVVAVCAIAGLLGIFVHGVRPFALGMAVTIAVLALLARTGGAAARAAEPSTRRRRSYSVEYFGCALASGRNTVMARLAAIAASPIPIVMSVILPS